VAFIIALLQCLIVIASTIGMARESFNFERRRFWRRAGNLDSPTPALASADSHSFSLPAVADPAKSII